MKWREKMRINIPEYNICPYCGKRFYDVYSKEGNPFQTFKHHVDNCKIRKFYHKIMEIMKSKGEMAG